MQNSIQTERITIVIETELARKCRRIQSKNIAEKQTSYSFSKVINDILRKGLK